MDCTILVFNLNRPPERRVTRGYALVIPQSLGYLRDTM